MFATRLMHSHQRFCMRNHAYASTIKAIKEPSGKQKLADGKRQAQCGPCLAVAPAADELQRAVAVEVVRAHRVHRVLRLDAPRAVAPCVDADGAVDQRVCKLAGSEGAEAGHSVGLLDLAQRGALHVRTIDRSRMRCGSEGIVCGFRYAATVLRAQMEPGWHMSELSVLWTCMLVSHLFDDLDVTGLSTSQQLEFAVHVKVSKGKSSNWAVADSPVRFSAARIQAHD
jgi:hypothetical protein